MQEIFNKLEKEVIESFRSLIDSGLNILGIIEEIEKQGLREKIKEPHLRYVFRIKLFLSLSVLLNKGFNLDLVIRNDFVFFKLPFSSPESNRYSGYIPLFKPKRSLSAPYPKDKGEFIKRFLATDLSSSFEINLIGKNLYTTFFDLVCNYNPPLYNPSGYLLKYVDYLMDQSVSLEKILELDRDLGPDSTPEEIMKKIQPSAFGLDSALWLILWAIENQKNFEVVGTLAKPTLPGKYSLVVEGFDMFSLASGQLNKSSYDGKALSRLITTAMSGLRIFGSDSIKLYIKSHLVYKLR